jgi:hypothetical protein
MTFTGLTFNNTAGDAAIPQAMVSQLLITLMGLISL